MTEIALVSEYFYPDSTSTGEFLTTIAQHLAESVDAHITVYSISGSQLPPGAPPNMRLVRLPTPHLNKDGLFSRLIRQGWIAAGFGVLLLARSGRNTVVFAMTDPALLLPVLAGARAVRRFRLGVFAQDVFPENAWAAGLASSQGLVSRLTARVFDWCYRSTDWVVALGRDMVEVIARKTTDRTQVVYVPHFADTVSVSPDDRAAQSILSEHGLEDKFVFQFAGNLGRVQGLPNLAEAMRLVRSENVRLLLIGDGAMRPQLVEFIGRHGLRNTIWAGELPSTRRNEFLNACQVAVVSLAPEMYGLATPSKTYFSMAAGKPILFIGEANSEIGRVVRECGIGWIVPAGSPEALAEMIDAIAADPQDARERGARARAVALDQYSRDRILARYTELFVRICGPAYSGAEANSPSMEHSA